MSVFQLSRPLDGLKVIDFTTIVLGPLATLCLADMGAEVIKIEPPEGDGIRNSGTLKNPGMSSIFLNLNRGKKSVAINLKSEESKTVLIRLVAWGDVLVHNMRSDAARRLGLDFETLRQVNPRIIYCSASGYAENSERAGEPAVDDVIQAASGISQLLAGDGCEPWYFPGLIADKVSGLLLCQGILGALLARERSGCGMAVSIPMREAMGCFNLLEHLGGHGFIPSCGPARYARLTTPYRRPMRTSDGYVAITPYSKRHWQQFFERCGRPDLANDPRVIDPKRRNAEIGDLYALLSQLLQTRTCAEWIVLAREAGIPVSPVASLEDLVADLAKSGHLLNISHPSEGETLAVGPLVRLNPDAQLQSTPAPRLGANNREILSRIGFTSSEIGILETRRAIVSVVDSGK